MRVSTNKRANSMVMVHYSLAIATLMIVSSGQVWLVSAQSSSEPSRITSYLDSARQLLNTGMEVHESSRANSGLLPNEDPRTAQMLRDTIEKTTDLINDYQQDGLSNLPALPNLPGLNTIMRLPDKLLRAELSMLQDGIRMAQELRERPITATVNAPRELANMFLRMTAQLNQ